MPSKECFGCSMQRPPVPAAQLVNSCGRLNQELMMGPLGNEHRPRVRNHVKIRLVRPLFLWLDLSDVVIANYGSTDLSDLHLREVLSGTSIVTTAEL